MHRYERGQRVAFGGALVQRHVALPQDLANKAGKGLLVGVLLPATACSVVITEMRSACSGLCTLKGCCCLSCRCSEMIWTVLAFSARRQHHPALFCDILIGIASIQVYFCFCIVYFLKWNWKHSRPFIWQ